MTLSTKLESQSLVAGDQPSVRIRPSQQQRSNMTDLAITFRKAYKHYGSRSRKVPVLVGLDMSIPKGSIYGLLGPSGCGKTTLLQCIVGKQRLNAGAVTVFGGKPGSRQSGVPGMRVGYMPQELALYGEFTIAETLQYFGRIFHMPPERIRDRTDFLIKFLDLPQEPGRLIMNLSGGQQRRASLAAALLHRPDLLILDEPTVGVDPLLRTSIWDHLLEISNDSHCTIVITTHYIEEARQAHVVGMMRFGRLLAEDNPGSLLDRTGLPSLEDVFLNLCLRDGDFDKEEEEVSKNNGHVNANDNSLCDTERGCAAMPIDTEKECGPVDTENNCGAIPMEDLKQTTQVDPIAVETEEFSGCSVASFLTWHRLWALIAKNFIRMWRNIGFLIFQFIIPTVQVSLFCLAIGRDPTGMTLAIVNEDTVDMRCSFHTEGCVIGQKDEFFEQYDFSTEHRQNLSCRFLSMIDPSVIDPVFFGSMAEATNAVKHGKHWGVIHFEANYTEALYNRMFGLLNGNFPPDNETLERSEVYVNLDMTNQQIGYTIQLRLAETYQAFTQSLLTSCSLSGELASLPISFEKPIYGSEDPTFTEFMAPGVILSITYFMAVGLTALSFIIERKEGLLDRSWVAGVSATEVMLAHVVAQFVVMVFQVALVLIFMIFVFKVPAKGPMVWIVLLTIFQGICGMAFGLVVSALCDNEQDAIQVALGSFYPNLLLSGIIWPLEGMPEELRYISYALPQTYACEAMRGILSRGWGIEWMQVYRGYLVTIAWTIGLLILSAVILRVRR